MDHEYGKKRQQHYKPAEVQCYVSSSKHYQLQLVSFQQLTLADAGCQLTLHFCTKH